MSMSTMSTMSMATLAILPREGGGKRATPGSCSFRHPVNNSPHAERINDLKRILFLGILGRKGRFPSYSLPSDWSSLKKIQWKPTFAPPKLFIIPVGGAVLTLAAASKINEQFWGEYVGSTNQRAGIRWKPTFAPQYSSS